MVHWTEKEGGVVGHCWRTVDNRPVKTLLREMLLLPTGAFPPIQPNIRARRPERALGLELHASVGTGEEKVFRLAASGNVHENRVQHLDARWRVGTTAAC